MKAIDENILIRVYKLEDPRFTGNDAVRYVGMTKKTLKERLKWHLHDCKRSDNKTHNGRWVKSLLSLNLLPTISLIAEITGFKEGCDLEMFWIKEMKERGCKLTNYSAGGEGISGENKGKSASRQFTKLWQKEEHRLKMCREVHMFSLSGTWLRAFSSAREAEQVTGIKNSNISAVALGRVSHAGGFLWSFDKNNVIVPDKIYHFNKIEQLTKSGELIKLWDSAFEASKALKITNSTIYHCLNGNRKTAGGFKWRRIVKGVL